MRIIFALVFLPLISFSQPSCDGGVQILNLVQSNGKKITKDDSNLQIKQFLLTDHDFKIKKEIPDETNMQWKISNNAYTFHYIQPVSFNEKVYKNKQKLMLNQKLVIKYNSDTMNIDFKNILPPNTIHWTIIDTLYFVKGNYSFDIKSNINNLPSFKINSIIDSIEIHKFKLGQSYYEINHREKFVNYHIIQSKLNQNNYYFKYHDVNQSLNRCRELCQIYPEERNISDYEIKINDIPFSGKIIFAEIYEICEFCIYNSRKQILVETECNYHQGKKISSEIVEKRILSPFFMRSEQKISFEKKLFQFAVCLKNKDKENEFLSMLDSLELTIYHAISKENIYIIGFAKMNILSNSLSEIFEKNEDVNLMYKKINEARARIRALNYLNVYDVLELENGKVFFSHDDLFIKWKPELDSKFIQETLARLNLSVESEKFGGMHVKFNRGNKLYSGPFKAHEPYTAINIAMYLKNENYVLYAEPITYSVIEEDK